MLTSPWLTVFPALLMAASLVSAAQEQAAETQPTQQFVAAETGEAQQGGATTHHQRLNRAAFAQRAANMSLERALDFSIGQSIFEKLWVSSPSSTTASDGLGPLYNARSCERCHLNAGRGQPPAADENAVALFLRLSIPPQTQAQQEQLASYRLANIAEPTYGGQLQSFAVPGLPAEGRLQIRYREHLVTLSEGETASLRTPQYAITELGYGPLHPQTQVSPRIAPPMIGLGLLEAIDAADILALADPEDSNNDGISGRANQVWDDATQQVTLGRFGWKAGNPSLSQQNNNAFNGDIGISTPYRPDAAGDCSTRQVRCRQQPNGNSASQGGVEASQIMTDLLLFYSRNLAVPARRGVNQPAVLAGKQVFYASGCSQCHWPKFVTAARADLPEQANQLIWPYSDLLLHDMGPGLADNRPEFAASGQEWRTPPLWGIGLTATVNGHTNFLHDGRARNLLEAILWHGGEAEPAKQRVITMPKQQRHNLLQFLESL